MAFIAVRFGGIILAFVNYSLRSFAFNYVMQLSLLDNEEELFNPNCVTRNLMDNIRRRCRCQTGGN